MKIIIFFILLYCQKVYGFFEKETFQQINYEYLHLKYGDYKQKVQTLNYELERKFHTNNIKLFFYQKIQYDLENKKITHSYDEFYLAALIKGLYLSIGRNPINWGVSIGKNPTNYFKAQEEFQYRNKKIKEEEGVDSLVINYTSLDNAFEVVLTDKKSAAAKLKTFTKGIDLSFSFYSDYKKKLNKWGFDYVYNFLNLNWFNIYGEFAYQSKSDFAYVCGINHQLSAPFRGDLRVEYMVSKKEEEDYLGANFNILSERIDLFLVSVYDLNNKKLFLMPIISFFPIENIKFSLFSKTSLKNKDSSESDMILEGKVGYYF